MFDVLSQGVPLPKLSWTLREVSKHSLFVIVFYFCYCVILKPFGVCEIRFQIKLYHKYEIIHVIKNLILC